MYQRLFQTLLLSSAMGLSSAVAAAPATPQQCAQWEQQLRQVQDRLRAGYRNNEGNRLRERRRWLQQQLARECRHQRPR